MNMKPHLMSVQYFLILLFLSYEVCLSQPITWQATSGPAGGYVRALTRDGMTNLFAATSGGVYKSTNGGDSWALSANGLGNSLVYSLAVSPNGTMYAGTFYNRVFRSTDSGNSWSQVGQNVYFIVNAIAINSQGDVFAGIEEGDSKAGNGGTVHRSTDNGNSWTEVNTGLPDSPVYQVRIGSDGILFVGMRHGLFRSTNNGSSWIQLTNGLAITWISDIAINPVNNSIFVSGSNLSGTFVAMYRSSDNGNSFTQLVFPDIHARTLDVSPAGHLFAATVGFTPSLNYGIFRSTDDGNSFFRIDSTLAARMFSFGSANQLFAGTNLGVHLSTDNGSTWQLRSSGMVSTQTDALASDNSNTIYAGTPNGPYRTTDAGANWVRLVSSLPLRAVSSITVNSRRDVFIMNDLGRLFRSTDRGEMWVQLTNGVPPFNAGNTVFAHTNDVLFAAYPFNGVLRSTDNGNTWVAQNNGMPPNQDVRAFASDQLGNIYAGTFLGGLYRSTNNGNLWSRLGTYNGSTDLVAVNASGHLFWVYNQSPPTPVVYLYRSTDEGTTWMQLNVSPSNTGTAKALLITPNQHFYVAVSHTDPSFGGVYRSTNNGDSFTPVSDGLTERALTSFGMDSTGHLLAGTTRGVFRTVQSIVTGVQSNSEAPLSSLLEQNYPNPFNPATTISFSLPSKSFVSLKVFDALGREVSSLLSEELSAGKYSQQWNAAGFSSGIYFYRLQAGSFVETKKLLLLR